MSLRSYGEAQNVLNITVTTGSNHHMIRRFVTCIILLFVFTSHGWSGQYDTGRLYVASWYNQTGLTASGQHYNPRRATVAHKQLPFGTVVKLSSSSQHTCVAVVNDRGPFIHGREFDLSQQCAYQLSMLTKGLIKIHVDIVH